MRIGGARYRWEFRLLDGESAADFDTLDALGPLLRPWVGRVGADELELVRVTEYTFRAQLADRWRRGRVFLLGDAAHLTPPFVGQGMGAGMRDAMNLAWKLAAVLDGTLGSAVLDTYQQERKPHTRNVIRLALAVGHVMTSGGRTGSVIRRAILPRLRRLPGGERQGPRQQDPRAADLRAYPKVPRHHGVWAAPCAPNPVTGGGRLDAELGIRLRRRHEGGPRPRRARPDRTPRRGPPRRRSGNRTRAVAETGTCRGRDPPAGPHRVGGRPKPRRPL